MASRNPDFAALSEAAYEAADEALDHICWCDLCGSIAPACTTGKKLMTTYRTKKDKALKAIRGKK